MECLIKFPVQIGDIVEAWVEDEDRVVEKVPYKVFGLAQIGSKQYVFDEDGEKYEIGTRLCVYEKNGVTNCVSL